MARGGVGGEMQPLQGWWVGGRRPRVARGAQPWARGMDPRWGSERVLVSVQTACLAGVIIDGLIFSRRTA